MSRTSLALTEVQHQQLLEHVFPGDGLEAGALLLCGRCQAPDRLRLVVREVVPIPLTASARNRDSLAWPTDRYLVPVAQRLEREELSVVLAHSHPGGHDAFSELDDRSDTSILSSVYGWLDGAGPHGSVVLLPDGTTIGRSMSPEKRFTKFERVSVFGKEIRTSGGVADQPTPAWGSRVAQAFGQGTWSLLRSLRIGVVGCSGTGSLVVEQLARTGVGELVLIDPKIVAKRNLNRILNSTSSDAEAGRYKVDVLADAIEASGLGTSIVRLPLSIQEQDAALALAGCDVVFGCVDSVEGRYILDVLSNAYVQPFIDVGVHIDPDESGGISSAIAASHYLAPGGSSLLSRGVYTAEQLSSEGQRRVGLAPDEDDGLPRYLVSVGEAQPAVMPINMLAASMAVTDFLARLHGFRFDDLQVQRMSLVHGSYLTEESTESCPSIGRWLGRGSAAVSDLWAEMCIA